jgi:hypothetical protein
MNQVLRAVTLPTGMLIMCVCAHDQRPITYTTVKTTTQTQSTKCQ